MFTFITILALILILVGLYIFKEKEDREKLPDDSSYVEPIIEDEVENEVKQED